MLCCRTPSKCSASFWLSNRRWVRPDEFLETLASEVSSFRTGACARQVRRRRRGDIDQDRLVTARWAASNATWVKLSVPAEAARPDAKAQEDECQIEHGLQFSLGFLLQDGGRQQCTAVFGPPRPPLSAPRRGAPAEPSTTLSRSGADMTPAEPGPLQRHEVRHVASPQARVGGCARRTWRESIPARSPGAARTTVPPWKLLRSAAPMTSSAGGPPPATGRATRGARRTTPRAGADGLRPGSGPGALVRRPA